MKKKATKKTAKKRDKRDIIAECLSGALDVAQEETGISFSQFGYIPYLMFVTLGDLILTNEGIATFNKYVKEIKEKASPGDKSRQEKRNKKEK